MVIRTLFGIQRQSSSMARGDKTWSSAPFLLSRDNQVRWHAKTEHGHPHLLWHLETIKYNMVIPLFAIQRQLSPMAREEKTWSSATSLPSRDNQVGCHAETKHGHPHCLLPIAVTFWAFMSQGNLNGDLPESASGRQVFKIKMDESKYRTPRTSVSLN